MFGSKNINTDWTVKDYTSSEGVLLHYGEVVNGRMPLVLLHGLGMSYRDYDGVLPQLIKRFDVYGIDLPGHGKSSKQEEFYTCGTFGVAIVDFVRDVIGKPCFISGQGIGGIVAAYTAGQEPDLVKGAVLEDAPFYAIEGDEMEDTFAFVDTYSNIHEFLEQEEEKNYLPFYLRNSYIFGMMGVGFADKLADEAEKYVEAHPGKPLKLKQIPDKGLHEFDYYNDFDLKLGEAIYSASWFQDVDQDDILESIQCPTVILRAKVSFGEDGVLWGANRDQDAERMSRLIGKSQMVSVKPARNIHHEQPKNFVKAVFRL